ncbi:hypothetical protein KIN20_005224 [Parelaphostrongylus tenuis]|uniref:Stalled ribosome sensor GCN1-like N-terminal domain-containing protein n=1 Tax=Parelaphostrongylus tenuis TaxID=148309 RepID=A0AAD5QHB7_PARTN|nr:hypothetical protein KIN20_005224 [Parelaphostrongylus tenuis]
MSEDNMEPMKENIDPSGDVDEKNEIDRIKEEVRKFTAVVSGPTVRLHLQAYIQLTKVISNASDLPQSFVKGLVKLSTTSAILRYRHRTSFKAVEKLLNALAKHDSDATLCSIAHVVAALFPLLPNISQSIAGLAIAPSKWLLQHFAEVSDAAVPELISALGNLAYYCSICPKASKIFERKLRTLSSGDKQAKRIRESVSEICKDASCLKKMLCFVSFLFLVDNRIDHDLFIDLFSKTILFSKSRPEDFVIKICDKGLSRISSESFHNLLLPNIKKSLLRSPEIAVFGVVRVIESIKFSIDDCFSDLLNGLSPCLTSTSEELSSTAVSVVVKMASKVEAPATEKVVGYLMELLSGARSPEQRVIILEGLAKCGVTE